MSATAPCVQGSGSRYLGRDVTLLMLKGLDFGGETPLRSAALN